VIKHKYNTPDSTSTYNVIPAVTQRCLKGLPKALTELTSAGFEVISVELQDHRASPTAQPRLQCFAWTTTLELVREITTCRCNGCRDQALLWWFIHACHLLHEISLVHKTKAFFIVFRSFVSTSNWSQDLPMALTLLTQVMAICNHGDKCFLTFLVSWHTDQQQNSHWTPTTKNIIKHMLLWYLFQFTLLAMQLFCRPSTIS